MARASKGKTDGKTPAAGKGRACLVATGGSKESL